MYVFHHITDINLKHLIALEYNIHDNYDAEELIINKLINLIYLDCSGNYMTS